ncbi:glycosyltransferase [Bradyrhizobium sp. LHD-71]|uniref:glycosyltransferase n=1 Tax=Bradyrhizobium sp. LHD-71 TaxID=3072141 RepID=UPI00280D8845|nr:glycosyltransferase [Bradyrhizobium sp. LHD-71]MDQ8727644.1 glycosyltransferase [Bradyrhizobium sp. LHD-71]
MQSILWISARLPAPLLQGDAIYSAGLIKALGLSGSTRIHIVGCRRAEGLIDYSGLSPAEVTEAPLPSRRRMMSLITQLPQDACTLASQPLQQEVRRLLQAESWSWIVIDHANSGGLLPLVEAHRGNASVCYIAHNAEGMIRPEIARGFGITPRGAVMRWDAVKYKQLEQRLLKAANLVICISDADAKYFSRFNENVRVSPPVYLGTPAEIRKIESTRPRSLLLVGSFNWIAKQKNLERIIQVLCPVLQRNGIMLEVIGAVPAHIRNKFDGKFTNLTFHGQVGDLKPLLERCRGGLVAEELGGGFKLKVLDYAFSGLPVFGLEAALEGSTIDEHAAMFIARSIEELATCIVANVDDIDALNGRQLALFNLASKRFGIEPAIRRLSAAFHEPISPPARVVHNA